MTIHISDWAGCYSEGWNSRLRPESFAHPAKVSYALAVRIYEHAIEEGWIESGQMVIDPFGGIGGFALEAMRHGLHFVGCELEQRFVDAGQGCDCSGISKADWVRFQGRWDRMRYEDGRYWCPECIMQASQVTDEREFKPLPLPGTKWATLAKTRQPPLFAAAPTASYKRNSGQIPHTESHHYRGNVETWEAHGMPGTAVIVQGDSRRLGEVLGRANLCLSSPPYTNQDNDWQRVANIPGRVIRGQDGYGSNPANLGNLPNTGFEAALAVSSPPFAGSIHGGGHGIDATKLTGNKAGANSQALIMDGYGRELGQLAQMPEDDHAEVCERPTITISSPPFGIAETRNRTSFQGGDVGDMMSRAYTQDKQGISPGQLSQMSPGDHAAALETSQAQACISSPPFEQSLTNKAKATDATSYGLRMDGTRRGGSIVTGDYGSTPGQLGQETGDTFWTASRQILEQVYHVLAPGGHAIFVVKAFVRNKAVVDFPGQWRALCEAVGFRTLHEHHALLTEDRGAQHTLDGGLDVRSVKRASFFRRLHESKYPHLAIDYEVVYCMEKP